MDEHSFSVFLNVLAMGVVAYVYIRWLREPKKQEATEKPPSMPPKRRFARATVLVLVAGTIIGCIFFISEWLGRKDATAVCNSISPGYRLPFDVQSLNAYRDEQKQRHGSLFAANFYPKSKGIEGGTGAVILVFLAGFPFSRAYCVVNLNDGVVQSTRLMFNAEDYEYCNGEMRGVWECKD